MCLLESAVVCVEKVTKEPSWRRPELPFNTAKAASRRLLKFDNTSALAQGLGNGIARALSSTSPTIGAHSDEVIEVASANSFWSKLTAACANQRPDGGRKGP
jgi:hypothetical protein